MNQDDSSRVLPFPWSRAAPPHSPAGAKDLGIGRMAQRLGVGDTHLNGH